MKTLWRTSATPFVHRAFHFAALVALVVPLALVVAAPQARADRDTVTRVDFLGWSGVNPDAFCIRVRDPQRGNRLEVRQIGNPAPVVSVKVAAESERQVFASAQFAPWSCVVPAQAGLKAPNGWLLFGQAEKGYLRIGVSNGKSSIQIGLVQARADVTRGGFARASTRTAYWSADSTRVVVIVNHALKSPTWGMDVDVAQGFKIQ